MIFADKLIELRKKNGWTQEELAAQMNVSRQSVSKWEGAQSIPDLEKILHLSRLFGVSTDYLLKDDLNVPEHISVEDDRPGLFRISMEEAHSFLDARESAARPIALGVALCILSPVLLILLSGFAEEGYLSENLAGGIGVLILLVLVSIAVGLFICGDAKEQPFRRLEKQDFETAYGVDGMVRERQRKLRPAYIRNSSIGVGLCILSPAPLVLAASVTEQDFIAICGVCVLLGMVALGSSITVLFAMRWEAGEILLREGNFTTEQKRRVPVLKAISTVYWLTVTAVFLTCGFVTDNWRTCGLIWPVAGILYGAVNAVCNLILKK